MSYKDWTRCRLGDICKINQLSYTAKDDWSLVNYLDTGNITKNQISDIQCFDPKTQSIPSRAKRKVQINDIIYSTVRPNQRHYGIIRDMPNNMIVSTGFTVLSTIKDKAYSEFIYFYLTQDNIIESFQAIGEQSVSTYPSIKPSDIENLVLKLPPFSEQIRIANILIAFEKKIFLNNRINDNLEQQAQAVFKSWFIDFEPFKKQEFVDSELGKIPKGWKVGKLIDIAHLIMGQSPSGSSYNEEGCGCVFYQGRSDFGYRFPDRRLYTTEPHRIADKNSILMSVRAPVGDINIAAERCCIGRGLASIKSKYGFQSFLLYTIIGAKERINIFNGEGTVFGSINKDSLSNIQILIPPEEFIVFFDTFANPIDRQIESNFKQIKDLIQLRDTLLPKLMSGELSVDDI